MSRKTELFRDVLPGVFQQHRHEHGDDLCRVAPSPQLQDKIKNELEQMGLREPEADDDAGTTTRGAAKKGGRKSAAKKGGRKRAIAGSDPAVRALIGNLIRQRQSSQAGLNDGLIIPGDQFPVGTPLRVIRSAALERAPLSGTVRIIVVLVNFSDKAMTRTKQQFKDLFFSTGVVPTGSVKEYFKEVSNNTINLDGEVVGPFTLTGTKAHYAHGDSGMSTAEPNARTMAREAAIAANPSVNYAPFDNDGNGFVDAFIVIHAGPGGEQTGNVNDIWSHKWVLAGGELNADGTKIFGYLTVPEDARTGVCAHELGHLLFGWPDLYDTDSSSSGIGNWCLMAGGTWNNSGNTPAHPSAWCKANQGWVSVVVQTSNQVVSIADVKTSKKVYRLWKDGAGGSEYFLVENRQKTKFDSGLPSGGLLVWHVDESIGSNSNEAHPKVALKQADGLKQLEAGTNRGDAGDSYPGSTNNKTFNKSSNPNSKSYAGVDTCVGVTEIGASAATMSAKLSVKCGIVKSLAKDITDTKTVTKDLVDNKSLLIEKQFDKQFEKQTDKQLEKQLEKQLDKKPEKPVIDKSVGLDKGNFDKPFEKATDKINEGGGGGFPGARGMAEPFIGGELRPDLSTGALASEEGYSEEGDEEGQPQQQQQPQLGSPQAKRMFDTKSRDF